MNTESDKTYIYKNGQKGQKIAFNMSTKELFIFIMTTFIVKIAIIKDVPKTKKYIL